MNETSTQKKSEKNALPTTPDKIEIPAPDFSELIAKELELTKRSVEAVLALFAEGGTVPFIARYRKEATGGLDEVQIRTIQERHAYLIELEDRRKTVITTIFEQGKLTDELKKEILGCRSKTELEDLYLPYKPKRRTRATIAKEKGLEPLALMLLSQENTNPQEAAQAFVDPEKDVNDIEEALKGARDIVAEIIAETAETRAFVREFVAKNGLIAAEASTKAKEQRTKFEQYYEFKEPLSHIPSHRFLALRRGEKEKMLRVKVEADESKILPTIEVQHKLSENSRWSNQLRLAIEDSHRRLLSPAIENDMRLELKQRSDESAVEVFAENLKNLLLSSPLGPKAVIGVDPGLRTGCKCAAIDATGRYLDTITIYLSQGDGKLKEAERRLLAFIEKYSPCAIAVGNGTGGRETESFIRNLLSSHKKNDIVTVSVNEAGASVYSASDIARDEFPDLDLTIRGAISIARRLQDPLAELVKIDPKSIGVGQYQHDVHQPLLAKKLGEVVESCVNQVGVELNTASAPLLAQVAGINAKQAKSIIEHREKLGAFSSRKALLKVSGLGPRTYEQSAGFLRIRNGEVPLDSSAVHPERYALVEQMAKDLGVPIKELVGNESLASKIDIQRYISDDVGEPTLKDIVAELKKPGRDPRASFEAPKFRDDINEVSDLSPDMILEGIVTNVTNFGAFVDIGVHQDGLVHISELADHFVDDPHKVVKVGQKLKIRVLEIDVERKRISLSARSSAAPARSTFKTQNSKREPKKHNSKRSTSTPSNKTSTRGQQKSGGFSNNPFERLLKK